MGQLIEAGEPHGLVPAGYRAIDSLRLEKGFRSWGADITPDDSPLEAGVGFAVALDKAAYFIGRDAVRRLRDEGVTRHLLRCLTLADAALLLGTSPCASATGTVATITSGGIGYAVGKSIAFAIFPDGLDEVGAKVSIEVFGEWVDAEVVEDTVWTLLGENVRA